MARLVLVDAWNAIHRLWPGLEDPDEARRRLVAHTQSTLLTRRVRGGAGRVDLLFDAHAGTVRRGERSRVGKVGWVYVEGSADEAILDRLRHAQGHTKGHHRILVVTDDRELAGRARQLGAAPVGVRAFYGEPARPPATAPPPPGPPLPPLRPEDFDLPPGPIDLRRTDPEAL